MTSPACTELEVVVMDWLAKMLGLPEEFLHSTGGPGGGIIQGSASEATLVGMLAARDRMVRRVRGEQPHLSEGDIRAKLIAYTSDQSNSSVWKSGPLGAMPMRQLPTDAEGRLRGPTLEAAMRSDRQKGLIPCYVVSTLGTTGTCAFDNLEEIGPVCREAGVWLHIDAAYAGSIFVCPEYRHLMAGVEHADSFDMNPHKWMLVNFDCSAMWVRDANDLKNAFDVDAIYLKHSKQGVMPDLRHWQLPLGRRFRALKLWMVLRCHGVSGIQAHIRRQMSLAKEFETLVLDDSRFEVVITASCGLVGFRMKGADERTKALLDRITSRKTLYMCHANVHKRLIIRFVVCSRLTDSHDVHKSWSEIVSQAQAVLDQEKEAAGANNNNNNITVDVCNGVCKGSCRGKGKCASSCVETKISGKTVLTMVPTTCQADSRLTS